MSFWLTDPELFLYAQGTGPDDVHLWRCKKMVSTTSSSLVVPMKPDDFEYVETVKNHLELIGDIFEWDELNYKKLIKYIFERRLLVNSQGFVIAELHKVDDKDGNKMMDDANNEVPVIYIRSLDVVSLKSYIPKLRERRIPLRTVKYLGDVNGKAAMMVEDSNVTKLTARVADLESKNKTLDTNVTKLTLDLAARINAVADLESKNIKLEGRFTKMTADLATRTNELATSQQELNRVVKNAYKEVWMNDLTNSEWVGSEGVRKVNAGDENLIFVGRQGTYTSDDNGTNVRARYMYKVKRKLVKGADYKAVSIEDLTPNKEKARFSQEWSCTTSQGKIYVIL